MSDNAPYFKALLNFFYRVSIYVDYSYSIKITLTSVLDCSLQQISTLHIAGRFLSRLLLLGKKALPAPPVALQWTARLRSALSCRVISGSAHAAVAACHSGTASFSRKSARKGIRRIKDAYAAAGSGGHKNGAPSTLFDARGQRPADSPARQFPTIGKAAVAEQRRLGVIPVAERGRLAAEAPAADHNIGPEIKRSLSAAPWPSPDTRLSHTSTTKASSSSL